MNRALLLLLATPTLFGCDRFGAPREPVGWELTPVLVVGAKLKPGDRLTEEVLVQRKVPGAFVTRSVVRPGDVALIANRQVAVPLQKGDLLLWTSIATADVKAVQTCLDAAPPLASPDPIRPIQEDLSN